MKVQKASSFSGKKIDEVTKLSREIRPAGKYIAAFCVLVGPLRIRLAVIDFIFSLAA